MAEDEYSEKQFIVLRGILPNVMFNAERDHYLQIPEGETFIIGKSFRHDLTSTNRMYPIYYGKRTPYGNHFISHTDLHNLISAKILAEVGKVEFPKPFEGNVSRLETIE